MACAERLRRIIEHEHAFGLGDSTDGIMIGALPEQIDRDDRRWLEAELDCGRDAALQRVGVHVEGRFIDINEYRRRTGQRYRLPGCTKCKGRTEHGVAAADALGHQHHQQRVGAACASHHMIGPAESRELRLKLRHFRTVDKLAMGEHTRDRLIDGFAEPPALRGDVDER